MNQTPTTAEPLFHDDKQIARLIGLSLSFVRKDRRGKRLIPFMRVQGRILYDLDRVRTALLAREEGGLPARRTHRAVSSA